MEPDKSGHKWLYEETMRETERREWWGDLFRKEHLYLWSMAKRLISSPSVPGLSEWPREKRRVRGKKALILHSAASS